MSKEQIEELAKFLWHNTNMYDEGLIYDVAVSMHNAGYRKQSEVAREIFGEIESNMHRSFDELPDEPKLEIRMEVFAELKKKYLYRCTDCKHFVGCECFSGKSCDLFES